MVRHKSFPLVLAAAVMTLATLWLPATRVADDVGIVVDGEPAKVDMKGNLSVPIAGGSGTCTITLNGQQVGRIQKRIDSTIGRDLVRGGTYQPKHFTFRRAPQALAKHTSLQRKWSGTYV
jgi:hypothetical protein